MVKHQLDPQIPPERQILAAKEAKLKSIKGQDKIIRSGEQYYMACHCGATEISSEWKVVETFTTEHKH